MSESGIDESASGAEALQAQMDELRAENEALRSRLDERSASEGRGYRRRWLSITCAVLGAILLPVAVATVWSRNTMLDTSEFTSTAAPLAQDEDIQEAVSFRVTEAVAGAADFRGIAEEALPADAQILAGPIEEGAKSLVADIVQGVVATDAFADLWRETTRAAHENLVPLLKGDDSDVVGTSEGRVVVRLGAIASEAVAQLDERLGTDFATQIPAEDLDAELVLVDSSELADVQDGVRLFDNMSWLTAIFAVAFLIGAVVFAERRRLGVRRLGIGVTISMVLALVAYGLLRDQYLTGLPDDVHNPDAAAAVFDILTRFLFRALRALLVAGLLLLVGAWVTGPSDSAARVRTWWDTLLGRASETGAGRSVGPVLGGIEAHERGLLAAVAVLGGLTLVLWTHPTGVVVLTVVVITALVMAAIRIASEVVRRSDEPGGQPPDDQVIDLGEDPTAEDTDDEQVSVD